MGQYDQSSSCAGTGTSGLKPLNQASGLNIANSSLVLAGKYLDSVEIRAYKVGSPTGDLNCKVYNSDGSLAGTSDAYDVSTLTTDTNGGWYTISFTTKPPMYSGSNIVITQTSGTNDDSNYPKIYFANSDCFSNTYMSERQSDGTWCIFNGSGSSACPWGNSWDAIGKYNYSDDPPPPETSGVTIPPPIAMVAI